MPPVFCKEEYVVHIFAFSMTSAEFLKGLVIVQKAGSLPACLSQELPGLRLSQGSLRRGFPCSSRMLNSAAWVSESSSRRGLRGFKGEKAMEQKFGYPECLVLGKQWSHIRQAVLPWDSLPEGNAFSLMEEKQALYAATHSSAWASSA